MALRMLDTRSWHRRWRNPEVRGVSLPRSHATYIGVLGQAGDELSRMRGSSVEGVLNRSLIEDSDAQLPLPVAVGM